MIRGRNGGHVVDDGSRVSGANGCCRGASWNELTATPRSMSANWSRMGLPVPGHLDPSFSPTTKIVAVSGFQYVVMFHHCSAVTVVAHMLTP